MTAARRRRYTAAAARYERGTQVVTTSQPMGFGHVRHWVLTRHGVVSRSFVGDRQFEVTVALLRPSNKHPQWQGTIVRVGFLYQASDPTGWVVAVERDYLDAEAALLPLRTRTRSSVRREECPEALLKRLEPAPKPKCDICGHDLVGEVCDRPDLHW